MKCELHKDFFDESCDACKQEYLGMKGVGDEKEGADDDNVVVGVPPAGEKAEKKYKELTEERAKKLYEELLLQFLKSGVAEVEADRKAKAIVRKQCSIRGIDFWPWL